MGFIKHNKGFCENCHSNAEPIYKRSIGGKFTLPVCKSCLLIWYREIKTIIKGKKQNAESN